MKQMRSNHLSNAMPAPGSPNQPARNQSAYSFEFLDHPGDLKCRARGRDLEGLFAAAAAGMMAFLFGSGIASLKAYRTETIEIEASDRDALLVDWLSELLYRATTEYHAYIDQVTILIHTGSRGLGHQTCTEYVRLMDQVMAQYGIALADRELACAPFASPEGQAYFRAMAAAANFAWCNRQLITYAVRGAWQRVVGTDENLAVVYDVSHNIAKLEEYCGVACVVHRKGATRAFGPGSEGIPERYRSTGQPVFVPGSMGTASYVLAGTDVAMSGTFGSTCHGAGRRLSRHKAKQTIDYNRLRQQLHDKGIEVRAASAKGLIEEAPAAYKDVEEVVDVMAEIGVAAKVARLVPIAIVKG
jgi:tRNA-splicing ligase RtcB (3'-phosphate/5'-hydroxy nucleic acid ligase)